MNKWTVLFCFIFLTQLNPTKSYDEIEDSVDTSTEASPQVEVRAVFINCEPEEGNVAPDSDSTRFEREELFKHSVLRDCNKKLALTVKITSEPDSSGDEYLPIEHVFEGPNKKRIRLLDPYILRLRREPPVQAYKLRRVDTISGVLVNADGQTLTGVHVRGRDVRDTEHSEKNARIIDIEARHIRNYLVTSQEKQPPPSTPISITELTEHQSRSCAFKQSNTLCSNAFNTTLNKRYKRSEHNIVVEEATDDNTQWNSNERYYRISKPERESVMHSDINNNYEDRSIIDDNQRGLPKKETARISVTKPQPNTDLRGRQKKMIRPKLRITKENESKPGRNKIAEKSKTTAPSLKTKDRDRSTVSGKYADDRIDLNTFNNFYSEETETDYAVYEIGNPELWYTVHVQLFEKLSTPDGKTVWNDLTKGEQASVSSMSPEWTGQDLNVRYRPAEWIPREVFTLPTDNLCLLAPIRAADVTSYKENSTFSNGMSEEGGYLVVPEEDVMGVKDEEDINKRNENNTSDSEFKSKSEEQNDQGRRRVIVRTSRALLAGSEEKVNIAYQGSEKYLTLPHRRPHHAQIDLEARADENELVRVGSSGRIAIAVADSTRRTRTIITLQIGNTGLAAARFRVLARDCGPALSDIVNEKINPAIIAGPALIPPRHTRTLRLELPVEIPVNVAHCSVSLVNDEDKSVAVREVAVKKGDRCFCVWHCDCVCLTEDPRLLCREMAEARQSAAGLSNRDRTRHARSACYEDVVSLNIFVVIFGVLMALLLLGFVKAVLGMLAPCVGIWGLDHLVKMPRKIDHYYERSLKSRQVEYDSDGYPVHPDTKERNIRMLSRPMEFFLNVIYFVSMPGIVVYDAIKKIMERCRSSTKTLNDFTTPDKNNTKKCFSSQDMQGMALRWRRRRGGLRRWMTPQAQELSKELWKEGLTPIKCEFMRPLLRDGRHEGLPIEPHELEHDSCVDSEQDDTDYVLSQMQKSRESLSILKQKSKS